MGIERRQHERVPCFIACEVQGTGKPVPGTTRDVSAGGLSVQVELDVEQGDVVHVLLHPERREDVAIEAIVWHARQVKQRHSGKISNRLGLVLSEAPDDFRELLALTETSRAKPRPTVTPQPEVVAKPASAKTPTKVSTEVPTKVPKAPRPDAKRGRAPTVGLPKPERYRVRVKLDASPRTRSILVFAQSNDEAQASALAETGASWQVLDVERA